MIYIYGGFFCNKKKTRRRRKSDEVLLANSEVSSSEEDGRGNRGWALPLLWPVDIHSKIWISFLLSLVARDGRAIRQKRDRRGLQQHGAAGKQVAESPPVAAAKRRRADFDNPTGLSWSSFYTHEDGRGETHVVVDTDTDPIGASYDFYLQCTKMSPGLPGDSSRYAYGGLDEHPIDISVGGSNPPRRNESRSMALDGGRPKSSRAMDGGLAEHPIDISIRGSGQSMALDGGRPKGSVPSDASRTLFVQGLPLDCTLREISHLFRPFVGYKEVRLIWKHPKNTGGHPAVLCFVDFASPAHAAAAKDALQGYKFDELDPCSVSLRLQFARYPVASSGGGHR